MNFAEPPENKIRVALSGKQWQLLQQTRATMDESMARGISVAVNRDNAYELHLTEREIDDLVDHLQSHAESATNHKHKNDLYTLSVFLLDFIDEVEADESVDFDAFYGPSFDNLSQMTGKVFVFKVALVEEKTIWRRIALRGGQTLHDLHEAIFAAFDREEEHLYSFYIPESAIKSQSIRKFMDCPEFTHPYALEDNVHTMFDPFFRGSPPENAAQTAIQDMGLSEKHPMLYLFDFGDEWLHWVTVEQTDGTPDDGYYPRLLQRKGQSPPQYEYEELDDDDWDTEDDF